MDPDGKYEVRLGWHHVGGAAYHAFVLVTDNQWSSKTYGWTWGFSAGPQRFGIQSFTNAGLLTDESGLYNKWHYDSTSKWRIGQTRLYMNDLPVGPLLNHLARLRAYTASLGRRYNLLEGPNSNTFASNVLDMIALHDNDWSGGKGADYVVNFLFRRDAMPFPGWRRHR